MIKLHEDAAIDDYRKIRIKAKCRDWRIANRYTISAIADAAGVSRQAVCAFELRRGFTTRILRGYIKTGMPVSEIIDAAGITLDDLFAEV